MVERERDENLAGMARGGALNLVGAAVSALAGLVLVVVIARGYPQGVAGAFFASTSVFLVLGAVCGLGTDVGMVRWLSAHLALGRPTDARRALPVAVVPVLAGCAAAASGLAVAAPSLAALIAGDSAAEVAAMLRVLAAFLPIAVTADLLLAGTRGLGTMRASVVVEKIGRQSVQLGAVVAVTLAGAAPAVLALAWAGPYLLSCVAAAGWYAVLTRRRAPRTGDAEPLGYRAAAAAFWRFTAPRALAQVCQVALQRADIFLVAALASPAAAAVYTAATRFMIFGQLGTQAVQLVMQPTVSRLLSRGDREAATRVYQVATTWTVLLTWPVYVTMAVAAPLYLAIFGRGYSGVGEPTVIILAVTMLLATASGPVDTVLLMAGRSGLSLANNAAALAVNLALNPLLIPAWGISGAAVARSAALVTRNALPLVQVRRSLAMSPVSAGLRYAAAAVGLCFGLVPLAVRLLSGTAVIPLLAAIAVGAVGYAGLLWVARARLSLTAFAELVPRRHRAARVAASP